jgi:hypothetical protein
MILIAVLLIIAGTGINKSFSQETRPVTSKEVANSSRSAITKMLQRIEQKRAPAKKMGAMCYDMAMMNEYQEYICPIDGEKTAYGHDQSRIYWIIESIVEMRRLVEQINSSTDLLSLKLDESKLCGKCNPDIPVDERYISLITIYPDGSRYHYDKLNVEDLRILAGFFAKKLSYETSNEGEFPLKDVTDKIKTLIGMEDL